MCQDNDRCSSDSGFIFGLVIGAIIGAFVAIYIYKNNQSQVFIDLKKKLSKYFSQFVAKTKADKSTPKTPKTVKKTVTLPKNIESLNLKTRPPSKPKKMFKK